MVGHLAGRAHGALRQNEVKAAISLIPSDHRAEGLKWKQISKNAIQGTWYVVVGNAFLVGLIEG